MLYSRELQMCAWGAGLQRWAGGRSQRAKMQMPGAICGQWEATDGCETGELNNRIGLSEM